MTSRQCWRGLHLVCAFFLYSSLSPGRARAEKTLLKNDEVEVFTDGRVAGFLSYVRGDALPRNRVDAAGNLLWDIQGGGLEAVASRQLLPNGQLSQGTLEGMRVRSGFIGNTLGLGVRSPLGYSTVTGYIQIWAFIESEARRKNRPNYSDVRQGYVKVEGWWGSVLVGRSRALFSRGATDIDVQYAHRYGLGYPGNIDLNGPTAGHIGFGVLGSGFSAGIAYATPSLHGLQLTVGVYDPIQLQGAWVRTKWVRPEAELTFERPIGQLGKFVLFGNGAYQTLYRQDAPMCADGTVDGSCESTYAAGFGYGGRLELGPMRLGVAGHYGRGLGTNYALEVSNATLDATGNLRNSDGYYVQTQLVLSKVDISAGWGITRVFLIPSDNILLPDPVDPVNGPGHYAHSVLKYQMGISAGAVYHLSKFLHLGFDFFHARAAWFLGERQNVNIANVGMTFTW